METVVTVNSIDELIEHLNKTHEGYDVENIRFEYSSYDRRIQWETHYVMIRQRGEKEYNIVGMSDGILKQNNSLIIP
jgi:hypothetical protein